LPADTSSLYLSTGTDRTALVHSCRPLHSLASAFCDAASHWSQQHRSHRQFQEAIKCFDAFFTLLAVVRSALSLAAANCSSHWSVHRSNALELKCVPGRDSLHRRNIARAFAQ